MKPFVFEIDAAPETVFAGLADQPYSLWLDSADRTHARGRYSYVMAWPVEIIEGNSFAALKEKLAATDKRDHSRPAAVPGRRGRVFQL